jgi:hypothetical protein
MAIVLCMFLAFEVHYVLAYQVSKELHEQFNKAKDAYFAEDYEGAKTTLENLVATLAQLEGMESFKGETYLLLGAAYEKLEYNNLAVKYYCMAKELLGEGKSIEGLDLNSLTLYWTECQTATGVAISVLIIQYEDGHAAYCAGDYEGAKVILEKLVSVLDRLEGWESLKGETYLVLGATYEELKYKELAIKYYCKAKEILGVGVTVDCIRLSKLRWYKAKCPSAAAAAVVVRERRRGGFGGFIGTLIGLGILAGLIWYLFFSKNAPFKKKEEGGGGTEQEAYSSACFSTRWKWHIYSEWTGSIGEVTFTPDEAPFPNENNGWEDEVTYTLSISGGGTLRECTLTLQEVEIGGGDGVQRNDVITINDVEKLNVTNTFNEDCSNPGSKIYNDVYVFTTSSKGSHTVKCHHQVNLPTGVKISIGSSITVTKK